MTDGTGAANSRGPEALAARIAAQNAIAASLVELERHPGHDMLENGPTLTGTTAARWATAREQIAQLWDDFTAYSNVVTAASQATDPAEVRTLLQTPSVEVRRTVVEQRITGSVEQVERIGLDALTERMNTTYGQVIDLVRTCHQLRATFLDVLTPLADRLRGARELATELGTEPERIRAAALTKRLHEIDNQAEADPLALTEVPLTDALAQVAADVTALAERLATAAQIRTGWTEQLAAAASSVAAVVAMRRDGEARHAHLTEIVMGAVPQLPEDHTRELHSRLAALDKGSWSARATGLLELRAAVSAATAELTQARNLIDGVVARRAELRGRFEAYRAKAVRLGRAEEPELLRLGDEIRGLLWTRPSDLAAATRALAAYQRALGRPA